MTNGYGYKTAVSPATTGGYGYPYPYPMGGQPMGGQPMPMPAMGGQMPAMQQVAGMQAMQPMPVNVPSGSFVTPSGGNVVTVPIVEESYVENILRLNRGKMATFYMTYENNREWNAKTFRGIVEAAGRDHIIISDPTTGMRYLLLSINLDYVTFDGPINYEYPFQGGMITNSTPLNTSRDLS
ncbi:spore germination protein Q [Paenibacillus algorifonticola]|uniref:Spore germination protein Q n=1 Tax=Paenibacillus algorifonticola TaxID=684063 RepID=A0A1I2HM57_9BACL|nr:spore coat protein GerQ [Paenibacillus algorifonticola]SFF30350.1 spore germination protein Q [Paenibacillus algorifonticola]